MIIQIQPSFFLNVNDECEQFQTNVLPARLTSLNRNYWTLVC